MTHVIFAHPHHDPAAEEFASAAAAFCRSGDSITRVDKGVYAPKGRPDATFLAAFKEFDRDAFTRLVQSVAWEYPWALGAFVRSPGAARFESIDLKMAFDIGRDRKRASTRGWGFAVPDQQARFLTDAYPQLLDRRNDLIRRRHFNGYDVLASVSTESPWAFECFEIFPEQRYRSSTRQEFGPGKDDWKWLTVEHRMIRAEMAVRGVYVKLFCDVAEIGQSTFEQVRAAAQQICAGDRVLIEGIMDVRADGECIIERVRRLERGGPANTSLQDSTVDLDK